MKKILGIAAGAVLAYVGQVMAQTDTSAVVGTPDSANMVIIEQGYEVVTPAVNTPSNTGMEALPGDPGVEVAPVPDNNTPAGQKTNTDGNITVDETVTETVVD